MSVCTYRNEYCALINHSKEQNPVGQAAVVGYEKPFNKLWHTANGCTTPEQMDEEAKNFEKYMESQV